MFSAAFNHAKTFYGNYLKSELKRFEGKFTTTFYCTDQHEKTLIKWRKGRIRKYIL